MLTSRIINQLITATIQTVQMVSFSTLFSLLLGFPLGVLLYSTNSTGLTPKPLLYQVLSRIVDVFRSFPFIILMILLFPISRLILHTAIGTAAATVPLSIAAAPFVARIIENALNEVDYGVLQAARSMGSTNMQIIIKVLIPESMPSVVSGITLTIINLIGYSAMAGTVGGGGLGDLAINYGFQRNKPEVLYPSVVVIILIVGIVQIIGSLISSSMMKRR